MNKVTPGKQKIYWFRIAVAVFLCCILLYGVGSGITKLLNQSKTFADNKLQLNSEGEAAVQKVLNSKLKEQVNSYSEQLLECQSSLKTAEVNLQLKIESCETEKKQINERINVKEAELQELYSMQQAEIETSVFDFEAELENTLEDLDNLQSEYDELVENSARSICCIRQFENSNIQFYNVAEGKIFCSDQGGEPLDCSVS